MRAQRIFGTVSRVGYPPDPWRWTDWRYAGDDGRFGGRWDDSEGNFRVIYAGESPYACFLELLAGFRADPVVLDEFDDIVEDPEDLADFPTLPPGRLPLSWASERVIGTADVFRLQLVDPSEAENIAELRPQFVSTALKHGLHDYDASALKNGSAAGRRLTQEVSTYLHTHTEYDGIAFGSRLGDDLLLLAIFERPGDQPRCKKLAPDEPTYVRANDPDLIAAMKSLGVVWDDGTNVAEPRAMPEEEAVVHVPVEILDESLLETPLSEGQAGQVYCTEIPDGGWRMSILMCAGLTQTEAESFEKWARMALAQVLMTGDPETNGWFPSARHPGTWHMTARARDLPPIS